MQCIAINETLEGTVCPLPPTRCLWQHRGTNECCHQNDRDLDLETYCVQVGCTVPTESEVQVFLTSLRAKL